MWDSHKPTEGTPNYGIIADRSGDAADGRIDGHENGWRARRTKARVNTVEGASGCY